MTHMAGSAGWLQPGSCSPDQPSSQPTRRSSEPSHESRVPQASWQSARTAPTASSGQTIPPIRTVQPRQLLGELHNIPS